MIHLYEGTGKGKTTAAMGLALRAAGCGWRVIVVEFLKDGTSGEALALAGLPNVAVLADKATAKFTFAMDEADRARAREAHDRMIGEAIRAAEAAIEDGGGGKGARAQVMIVLDEALDAIAHGLADETLVRRAAALSQRGAEIVFTGRTAPAYLADAADYITEMECLRHPYERGVPARRGVEW